MFPALYTIFLLFLCRVKISNFLPAKFMRESWIKKLIWSRLIPTLRWRNWVLEFRTISETGNVFLMFSVSIAVADLQSFCKFRIQRMMFKLFFVFLQCVNNSYRLTPPFSTFASPTSSSSSHVTSEWLQSRRRIKKKFWRKYFFYSPILTRFAHLFPRINKHSKRNWNFIRFNIVEHIFFLLETRNHRNSSKKKASAVNLFLYFFTLCIWCSICYSFHMSWRLKSGWMGGKLQILEANTNLWLMKGDEIRCK